MLNLIQKCTIQAIVNVFETGRPAGDYDNVTVAAQDPGHLSYGRSQVTLASGTLARLVQDYCQEPDAALSAEFAPYLALLAARDVRLDGDARLHALLRDAGADPAMRRVQDALFDRAYWEPACRAAQGLGIVTALGTGVVYDSFIQGGWIRMRDATAASLGRPKALPEIRSGELTDEPAWVSRYIAVRRNWLATHANPLLRLTTYRMDTFAALAAAGNWALALPIVAHGVRITDQHFEPAGAVPGAAALLAGGAAAPREGTA